MPWTPPSTPSLVLFLLVVAAVLAMLALGLRRAAPDRLGLVLGLLLGWMGVTAGLASSGVLEAALPASVPPFMLACVGLGVALALSSVGRALATLPLAALVGFQGFRLPLEVVLHQWATEGVIPVAMSWSGRNLDVITGVLALLLIVPLRGPLTRRRVFIAQGFNLVGLLLLLNVMVTALLSSPVPFRRFMEGPPLQLAFHTPTVWIVPVCVAGAMAGHLVLWRKLAAASRG